MKLASLTRVRAPRGRSPRIRNRPYWDETRRARYSADCGGDLQTEAKAEVV